LPALAMTTLNGPAFGGTTYLGMTRPSLGGYGFHR
jgi:hypothetical protein